MTGYLHRLYAESLAEYGVPRELTNAGGWILERHTPISGLQDAMGCYPLFCCLDWQRLEDDLNQLRDTVVSVSLVTDPFGNYTPDFLKSLFAVVLPYKQHFVADLSLPLEQFISPSHLKYGHRAVEKISVEICSNPAAHLNEWVMLYNHLIERRQINGMRRFSRECFARQLAAPGLVMFRASLEDEPLSLDLWYIQGEVAQGHLVCTSPRGYELHASYGLKLYILQYFTGKVRWVNLGALPGLKEDTNSGLASFKRGWSSETRTAFFCGKILNPRAYQELVRATRSEDTDYFPAYRRGEFS
ncbi:MAG: hypothetical protein ACXWMK_13000 [Syntrophales bacterium]